MRQLITFFLIIICQISLAQTYPARTFQDSIHHFSIDIPAGWKHVVNKSYPDIKIIAIRSPVDSTDRPAESYNLTLVVRKNTSLEEQYKILLEVNKQFGNFEVVESGDLTIQGLPYKWYIDHHANNRNKMPMASYVFITYKNEKTYILTFTTIAENFDTYRKLFLSVANSLTIL